MRNETNLNEPIYVEGLVTVSAKVSAKTKAKLLREAKSNDMTLSQYMAYTLDIEGENQKEVERLREQLWELELKLNDKKQAFTDEAVNCNQDAILGLQDTLAHIQKQIQGLYDAQPQDLKERIKELEQENQALEEQLEELREKLDNQVQEELDEDMEKLQYETQALRNQNKTDCAKFQRLGEEALVRTAFNQFKQVVEFVAKDYTFKDRLRKNMWTIFRGLPKNTDAWNLVENPYSEVKR